MFKTVAIAVLTLGALTGTGATEGGIEESSMSQEQQSVTRAKQVLAEKLKIALDEIEVTRVEPKTWNDSSLGCGKPGTLAMQVITHGYAISLTADGREHTIHVAGNNAVICDRAPLTRKNLRRAAPARGLDLMMDQARQDLAQRLGVEPAKIRIAGMQPKQWTDSAMECPRADEKVEPGPIPGYRLSLKHASRVYTYHTDMKTVRACPAIEKE